MCIICNNIQFRTSLKFTYLKFCAYTYENHMHNQNVKNTYKAIKNR